jgi:4-hydroxy-2-oxoheptanedioate aldolase
MILDAEDTRLTLGAWCTMTSSISVEVLARAGFDWLCLDLQHGLLEPGDTVTLLQAAATTATPTFVRVSSQSPTEIGRVLDFGADGVIVPMVETADQARVVAQACRYPPTGSRSWGPTRAALVVPDFEPDTANRAVICGAQIETRLGAENLERILAVDGLDLVMVGPNDLALSMGLSRVAPDSPEYVEILRSVPVTCQAHGVVPAIFANTSELAEQFAAWGYRAICVVHDVSVLGIAARAVLDTVRASVTSSGRP